MSRACAERRLDLVDPVDLDDDARDPGGDGAALPMKNNTKLPS